MKTGIVLLNMGGPETLEDVHPFLYNLFSDRKIIKLGPPFLQKPIAWYIARKRAPKSRGLYRQIGGGSPLIRISQEQAKKLETLLNQNGDVVTTTAMRYCSPSADEAIAALAKHAVDRIILLPLYPHYSLATSGSSIVDFQEKLAASPLSKNIKELKVINDWPDHPAYIQCLVDRIENGLKEFDTNSVGILYSAHSLPVSLIEDGDPYVDHLNRTIKAIEAKTGKKGTLCYQSRSGPVKWLSPGTSETIVNYAEKGCKNLLVLPISFVSDHVETLYEVDIMFKEEAREVGIDLRMTEGLNAGNDFISALEKIVRPHL